MLDILGFILGISCSVFVVSILVYCINKVYRIIENRK